MKQDPVILTSETKDNADERLKRVLSASVAQVEKVEATIQLSGTVTRPQWKIRTNLGDQIARGVKRGVGEELSAEKDALIAKLNTRFTEKQKDLVTQFNDRYKDSLGKLDTRHEAIQKLIPQVAGGNPLDVLRKLR